MEAQVHGHQSSHTNLSAPTIEGREKGLWRGHIQTNILVHLLGHGFSAVDDVLFRFHGSCSLKRFCPCSRGSKLNTIGGSAAGSLPICLRLYRLFGSVKHQETYRDMDPREGKLRTVFNVLPIQPHVRSYTKAFYTF